MKLIKPGTPEARKTTDPNLLLAILATTYEEKATQVQEFQAKNEPVFTRLHALKEAEEVAANELRTAAKQYARSFEGERVKVEYVMPKHRYLDPEVVEAMVPENIRKALGIIVTTKSVDEKVLKAMIKAGKIKDTVLTKALIEEETGSPRVTITLKETIHANQE
jgi:hypothetical protein